MLSVTPAHLCGVGLTPTNSTTSRETLICVHFGPKKHRSFPRSYRSCTFGKLLEGHENMRARKRPVFFGPERGTCACTLRLPKVLKHSAMRQLITVHYLAQYLGTRRMQVGRAVHAMPAMHACSQGRPPRPPAGSQPASAQPASQAATPQECRCSV